MVLFSYDIMGTIGQLSKFQGRINNIMKYKVLLDLSEICWKCLINEIR